ncbi:MAG: hypothetical protein JO040_10895 [Gemmatimonadetes bacterium]|nr:hypothetical protein [Gemmatimonadota bacterium]
MKPILFAALLLSACTGLLSPGGDEDADRQEIVRLEAEARALAKTDGCGGADQCRSAPLGAKACGGPRDYVAYCAATTDTIALFRKLEELRTTEETFNRRYGVVSTCDYVSPPGTELNGATCRLRPR